MSSHTPELLKALDDRLTQLEIKASFADDTIDQLNAVLIRQQREIDRLLHEVAALRQQQEHGATPAFRSLRDELPPHY